MTQGDWVEPTVSGMLEFWDNHTAADGDAFGKCVALVRHQVDAQRLQEHSELIDCIKGLLNQHIAYHNTIEHAAARQLVARINGKASAADLKSLKPGDSVIYKNVGYGMTTYEPGDGEVIEIRDGKLFTLTFDRNGLTWCEARQCWRSEGSLGLTCYAIAADDPTGMAEIEMERCDD